MNDGTNKMKDAYLGNEDIVDNNSSGIKAILPIPEEDKSNPNKESNLELTEKLLNGMKKLIKVTEISMYTGITIAAIGIGSSIYFSNNKYEKQIISLQNEVEQISKTKEILKGKEKNISLLEETIKENNAKVDEIKINPEYEHMNDKKQYFALIALSGLALTVLFRICK